MQRNTLLNVLTALLMVAMLLCQFTPFWHYGEAEEEKALSIQTYVWFPTDHQDIEGYFEDATGKEYNINQFVIVPILVVVSAIIGLLLLCMKPHSIFPGILAVLGGLSGTCGYLLDPVLRLGNNWGLHLIVSILMLVVGIAALLPRIRSRFAES